MLQRAESLFLAVGDDWGAALAKTYEGVVLALKGGQEAVAVRVLQEGHARCVKRLQRAHSALLTHNCPSTRSTHEALGAKANRAR